MTRWKKPHTGRARQLRRTSTDAERALWSLVRRGTFGVHFRRQHPIGPFIVDFACPEARLVLELDGGGHATPEREASDAARDRWLWDRGWRVWRFWNDEVLHHPREVAEVVLGLLHSPLTPLSPPLRERGEEV